MDPITYAIAFRAAFLLFIIPNFLIFIPSFASSRKGLNIKKKLQSKKTLREGLKKNAAGSLVHTAVFVTYGSVEKGLPGLIPENILGTFFLLAGIFGSVLLIWGYVQIYKNS